MHASYWWWIEVMVPLNVHAMTDDELRAMFGTLQQQVATVETNVLQHVSAVETNMRRHFDVTAEGLRHEIQQVAEGVINVDERLTRARLAGSKTKWTAGSRTRKP
jgi:hypothetical protein